MESGMLFQIVQIVRTLLPLFATIGTISSIVGFWRIFQKWNKPGMLSLIPFARGWIFGKDSGKTARTLYALSDGMIAVLTPIFYYIRIHGDLQEYPVGRFVFYVDRAMLIVTAIWAVAEVIRFLSSVHISANLCRKNHMGKAWIFSWVLFPMFAKIAWGFSDRFLAKPQEERKLTGEGTA